MEMGMDGFFIIRIIWGGGVVNKCGHQSVMSYEHMSTMNLQTDLD